MLKAQTALATGHFSNQLGYGGAVTPLPQYKQGCAVQVYESGTSIPSTNKDVQYEQGTSSVQMEMRSMRKPFYQYK